MKYNYCHIEDNLDEIKFLFPSAFISLREELILDRTNNIYFRLDDVKCKMQFDCKMIEFLSRPAHKGLSKKKQTEIRNKLNKYFDTRWSIEDISLIYTYLGKKCNRKLCLKFIDSDFDLSILKKEN